MENNNNCYDCGERTHQRRGSYWFCRKCNRKWDWVKPKQEFRMKFGRYLGEKLEDIPLPYLHWGLSSVHAPTLSGDDFCEIEEYLAWKDPKEEYKLDLLGEVLPHYPHDNPILRYRNRDKKEHSVPRDWVIVLEEQVFLRKTKNLMTTPPKQKYKLIVYEQHTYNVEIEAENEDEAQLFAENKDYTDIEPDSIEIVDVLINGDDDDDAV